ncbi:MAG TPA: TMEM175 family protein [Ktedonobacterales bacterium]|nr:TMEM175 family protein [Ktedonobacterales bacterium]
MSTNRPDRTEGIKETGRVEAFSDGVFAIAVTLLVLNLNVVPETALHGTLAAKLLNQWPMFLAYIVSFAFILIMWINHHNMFRAIKTIHLIIRRP